MPRALLSVYNKAGLVDLARGLAANGWDLVASGGTARALREAGIDSLEVSEVTGFPEVLDGRVKTLHPAIHAAILATDGPAHQAELDTHGITPIDLVVCNLYPFSRTIARPDCTFAEAIEQIDIGGVTLLRAAAKNHARVTVLCDPADYQLVSDQLVDGDVEPSARLQLALKAFRHTSAYDAAIRDYLETIGGDATAATDISYPPSLHLDLTLVQSMRYGENPHQSAALYNLPGHSGPLGGRLLHGKPVSYNNILDLEAAWRAAQDFDRPTVAIIKHNNPCGLASAESIARAFRPALDGDPVSAYGGVIAANRRFELDTAEQLGSLFVECIIAPGFSPKALELLQQRKNLRLLDMGETWTRLDRAYEYRSVTGGILVQEGDTAPEDEAEWRVVTDRHPTASEWVDLRFAWKAAKHIKSNAIAFAKGEALVGVGAGQMSRADSAHMAAYKAGERAGGAVLGSDAFFPFADGLEISALAGVRAAIQPGGSVRDDDVVAAANRHGMAMIFTGRRHFKH